MIVARAPPPDAVGPGVHTWAPRLGLKPAKLSPLARWKVSGGKLQGSAALG